MNEIKFSEYWAQAQMCYFRAEAAKGPAAKHLWIQLAQDWIALADTSVTPTEQQFDDGPRDDDDAEPLEQLEPFMVA